MYLFFYSKYIRELNFIMPLKFEKQVTSYNVTEISFKI